MPTFQLSDDVFNDVLRLANQYRQEAEKCRDARAFLAGCIMIGAAFEAMLLSFANCYPEEVLKSTAAPRRKGKIKPLIEWSLFNLLAVARECNWLPSALSPDEDWDNAKAQIGDYGVIVKELRNLVHPARYAIDWSPKRVTKKYLDAAFDIIDTANEYLLHRLTQSIQEAMEEEDANCA